jgi:hypothetical protein
VLAAAWSDPVRDDWMPAAAPALVCTDITCECHHWPAGSLQQELRARELALIEQFARLPS